MVTNSQLFLLNTQSIGVCYGSFPDILGIYLDATSKVIFFAFKERKCYNNYKHNIDLSLVVFIGPAMSLVP